ncbi:reverse transcriptase domain-containing protein [Tanacetum coccineum]|uniref:Reverse transcriptase domain-containing protein n=1 Tax=Tanacetum coccineum TaxID=301880 RepID=A0ABQ5ERX0_9ASTR
MTPIYEYLVSGLQLEDLKKARKYESELPSTGSSKEKVQRRAPLHDFEDYEVRLLLAIDAQGDSGGNIGMYTLPDLLDNNKSTKPGYDFVNSAWPFSHCGINIMGPLHAAPGGLKFLAIAIEHFTKWVEAKPLTKTSGRQVEKFIWEHVIYRFGVPQTITSKEDNLQKESSQTFVNG